LRRHGNATERPFGLQGPGIETVACAHGGTAASSHAAEGCEAAVRRLNGVLIAALSQMLPADSATTGNLVLPDIPSRFLGATFFPRGDADGWPMFEAPLRIRAGIRLGVLHIALAHYDAVPANDDCPDKDRLADMASKGMTQHRCDRTVVEGAIVVVHDTSAPHGAGQFAGTFLHDLSVTAYRPDGMRVWVTLSPVVEHTPEDADARRAVTENILTLAQLQTLAMDSKFVVA
jgi:hypothetical protein